PSPLVFVLRHALELLYQLQPCLDPQIEIDFILGFLVTAARHLLGALDLFVDRVQISQSQFGVDHFDVVSGRDPAADVDYIIVIEAAHDVNYGIRTADVAQKLVAEPFARAGALDQAGNIDEFNGGRLDLLRVDDGRQL